MAAAYPPNDLQDESSGRLFLLAYRDFQVRCVPMLEARGHGKLTAAHITALTHIDAKGIRIVTLAERANMTKQSMGDLIQELETQGYVSRIRDSDDKRAHIITLTELGQKFFIDAQHITQEIDRAYADILGENGLTQLRGLLIKLLEHATGESLT